jgi:hypothetical protein
MVLGAFCRSYPPQSFAFTVGEGGRSGALAGGGRGGCATVSRTGGRVSRLAVAYRNCFALVAWSGVVVSRPLCHIVQLFGMGAYVACFIYPTGLSSMAASM